MKIKKSNIVLFCLVVVFFTYTAINFHIYYNVVQNKIKEQSEIVQSENLTTPAEVENK